MKKQFAFLLAIIVAGITTSYAQQQTVRGNGNMTSQSRNVESFNKVHSSGSFDVIITDGADRSVKVEAEENLQPYIEVTVKGNALTIRTQKGFNLKATKSVKVYVTATGLEAVASSGSGNVSSTNQLKGSDRFDLALSGSGNADIDVRTSDLKASLSGSGNIKLKGSTRELDGRISGSGNIWAKNMQSEITHVKISGSGNAEVVATQKLDTKIAGSGDVKYWGDASVDSKVSGSGSVRREK